MNTPINIMLASDLASDLNDFSVAISEVLPAFNIEQVFTDHAFAKNLRAETGVDLIFVRTELQPRSGFACLKAMGNLVLAEGTPVIMYSSKHLITEIVKAHHEGACMFLIKPLGKNEMLASIKKVFHRLGLSNAKRRTKENFVVMV